MLTEKDLLSDDVVVEVVDDPPATLDSVGRRINKLH
jgi:hypothetical protein